MQHWQWVQVISGITLVKIYCMPPKSSFFNPCSFRTTQQGRPCTSALLPTGLQSQVCITAGTERLLKWLGMKIKSSFNNNQVGKWQNYVFFFFFSTPWLTQNKTFCSQWRCSRVKSVNLFLIRFAPWMTPTMLYKDLRVKENSVVSWWNRSAGPFSVGCRGDVTERRTVTFRVLHSE